MTTPGNPFGPLPPKKDASPSPQENSPTSFPGAAGTAHERYRTFLSARGMDGKKADRIGYIYMNRDAVAAYLGYDAASDAVAIPYFDQEGAPIKEVMSKGGKQAIDYMRLRLLNVEGGGKYRQAKGTKAHARLTPNSEYAWPAVAKDAAVPVIITEGEFKCDLPNTSSEADKPAWLPVVGIGGVDSWGGRTSNRLLLPELDGWAWEGRTVYLAFDHDGGAPKAKRYTPEVMAALDRLAAMLVAVGARVELLHLADTATCAARRAAGDLGKLGLDDFILAGGGCAELLATSEPTGVENPVAGLLANYAIMEPTQNAIDLRNGAELSIAGLRLLYSNSFIQKGDKMLLAVRLWEASASRRTVRVRGFWPDRPHGLVRVSPAECTFADARPRAEESDGAVVAWNDWVAPDGWDDPWTAGERELEVLGAWNRLVAGLCGPLAPLMHDWIAQVCQHPTEKNHTCWVITSPHQGIGKSLMCETVAGLMGGSGIVVGPETLGSRWNDYAYRKLVVVASEMEDARNETENAVKNLVTAGVVHIERKGANRFAAANYANLLISTNRPLAFRVSADGRREIIWRPEVTAGDEAWMTWVRDTAAQLFIVAGAVREQSLRVLRAWYRKGYKQSEGYKASARAPMTDMKMEAAEQSKSHNEQVADMLHPFLAELIERNGGHLLVSSRALKAWVQVQMAGMGEGGSGEGAYMTVIKHLRPRLDGATRVMRLGGRGEPAAKFTAFGLTEAKLMTMSPAERRTFIDNSEALLLK